MFFKASFVGMQVRSLRTESDPERQKAKEEARTFLGSHPDASVVIVLDGYKFSDDGTVVFYDRKSAPLPIVSSFTLISWTNTYTPFISSLPTRWV